MSNQPGAQSQERTPREALSEVRDELSRGELRAAADMLSAALAEFPELDEQPSTHLLIGRCAHELENFRAARQHYRFAAQDPKIEIEALYRMGRSWLDSGRFERAVFPFMKVAADKRSHIPFRVHANSGLAAAYAGLDRHKSAEQAIERAAAPGLISGQLLADEAFRLASIGGTQEAQNQLTRALQIDGECVDAHALLANLLLVNERGDEALEVLVKGLHHAPQNLKLLSLLAEVHYSMREYREAAAVYQRCLELAPQSENADATRMSFARCFYHAGRPTQTKVELELLLKYHPMTTFKREAEERIASMEAGVKGGHLIAPFPRTLQRRNYCAPNTVANVLRFFGFDASQDDVAERVLTNGTRWQDLVSYLKNLDGMRVYAFQSDRESLFPILRAEIPVIVGEYEGMEGHCIALTGYDTWPGVFYAQDPNFFDPVEITFGEFERSWRYTDQLVVIVVPDDPEDERTKLIEEMPRRGEDQISRWLHALRLQADGNAKEATQEFQALAEEYPDYLPAQRALVEARISARDFPGANDLLQALRERLGDLAPYWVLRYSGDVTLRLGEPDDAMDFYAAARKVFDGDPILHYVEAEIALALDRKLRGRAELVKSLELNPTMLSSRIRLARECLESGELRFARYHAEAALEIAPDSAKALDIFKFADEEIKLREAKAAGFGDMDGRETIRIENTHGTEAGADQEPDPDETQDLSEFADDLVELEPEPIQSAPSDEMSQPLAIHSSEEPELIAIDDDYQPHKGEAQEEVSEEDLELGEFEFDTFTEDEPPTERAPESDDR